MRRGRDRSHRQGECARAGKTLKEANREGLLSSGTLVVQINRGEETTAPSGNTAIQEDDFVTVHSRSGVTDETLGAFTGK